jgi:hypothetical protein
MNILLPETVSEFDGDVDVSCNYYFKDDDELKFLEANFSNEKWRLVNENAAKIFTVQMYKDYI